MVASKYQRVIILTNERNEHDNQFALFGIKPGSVCFNNQVCHMPDMIHNQFLSDLSNAYCSD